MDPPTCTSPRPGLKPGGPASGTATTPVIPTPEVRRFTRCNNRGPPPLQVFPHVRRVVRRHFQAVAMRVAEVDREGLAVIARRQRPHLFAGLVEDRRVCDVGEKT